MATLNSIDGQITSGGDNPPIGVEFPATNYSISCLASGSIITYYDLTLNKQMTRTGVCGTFSVRTNKIISMSNAVLKDVGLIFNIPKPDVMPKFVDLNTFIDKTFPVKTLKVYFGTPVKPFGAIVWIDETGQTKNEGLFGTTVQIKATKIIVADNVRIEELSAVSAPVQAVPVGTAQPQPTATTTSLSDPFKALINKIFNDARSCNLTAEQYIQQYFK